MASGGRCAQHVTATKSMSSVRPDSVRISPSRQPPELDPDQNAGRRLSCRLRNRRRVEGNLTTVAILAGGGKLAIGLVVDDRPRAVLLEGQIDDAFDQRAIGQGYSQWRFAPTCAAKPRCASAHEEVVRQNPRGGL